MVARALLTSTTDEWATPQDLFDRLHAEFGFRLDVCATPENAKYPVYYTRADNALIRDWARVAMGGAIWMNPPYGREIYDWVSKAAHTAYLDKATVVCLVPARTDTAWWHTYVQPILDGKRPGEVRFLRGRLKFGGSKNSAPFPSAVVVMRGAP